MKPLDPSQIRNLLVRGTNWVGDSVLSLPALKSIRQSFPHARIVLLVLPWVSGVYEECVAIDEVFLYERDQTHRGTWGRLRLAEELRARKFDAAILFQNAFEAAVLARLAGISIRAGYDRDGRGWLLSHRVRVDPRVRQLHQTYYYLDLVDQLIGGDRSALAAPRSEPSKFPASAMPDISIAVSPHRKEKARVALQAQGLDFDRPLVGVNPGAFYGSAKRWFSERYATLLDRLMERQNVSVAIFGGANELHLADAIQTGMRNKLVVLSGRTQLAELIAMISCCDLIITNDSGPMHLAAAVRVPTLAIFGSTDELATGPMSPTAVVVNKRVECSPCLLRECPIDHRCMTRISVDEVYEVAVRMLREGNNRASP
jgi:heptosyltransferase-2